MKNVLVIPWAYEEWNLVQFFQEYMLASLYMLIRQFGRIRFIVNAASVCRKVSGK